MARKTTGQQPEKQANVVIRSTAGRKKAQLDAWRYWEIVGALRELGADRKEAYSSAYWATRARPGEHRSLPSGITMEVR